jgi:hypothetical protein
MTNEQVQDSEFEVNEFENRMTKNLLEKGRYKGKCVEAVPHVGKDSGNRCIKATTLVGDKRITDYLVLCDAEGKKHKMTYKAHNFLFACGIRNSKRSFTLKGSQVIGKEYLVDVSDKKDGSDNQINSYSPIEEETAPMEGVPPENITPETKPQKGVEVVGEEV